jgi:hypothetical protein
MPYPDLSLGAASYYASGFYGASAQSTDNEAYRNFALRMRGFANDYLSGLGLPRAQIENRTLDISPTSMFQRVTGTPNYLQFNPFGNMALANFGNSAGMFSPFAPNSFNQYAALTEPYSFNPQFVDLSSYRPENVVGTLPAPTSPQEVAPQEQGSFLSPIWDVKDWLDEKFKVIGLLVFALILIVLGLYFLAKSTDEGKIAIGALKKVATSGAA